MNLRHFVLGLWLSASWALLAAASAAAQSKPSSPPNVVLIMTDDQGYGDLACHGNAMIQTPHLDTLFKQSVRLTNYHSDPTCAETRAALMTGRYSCRAGVWHTVMGRSILRSDETTLPEAFGASGYATGIFGKWHLGDNFPYRPQDRGFQASLIHGGGGVGQIPDHWGNDYFDDTYLRNGTPEKQTGYCTDIWFANAAKFIESNKEKPFFCYIATNAPHDPLNVPDSYVEPYRKKGVGERMAKFYGMISCIDENIGRLLARLDEWKLSDNTVVIFVTDNGTGAGFSPNARPSEWRGFNAGMRATKGSHYEGGHRVPCLIRWPAGKLATGRDVPQLAAHFDLFPTLQDICGLKLPREIAFDGRSLRPLLHDPEASWQPRTLVVHSQRMEHPQKWNKTAVMTQAWRLLSGGELYDIQADPRQTKNVAAAHPEVVKELTSFYDAWWSDVSRRFNEYARIPLGSEAAPTVLLTCHDWHTQPIAYQSQLQNNPDANGFWAITIAKAGTYRFVLRDRPAGVEHMLSAAKASITVGEQTASRDVPAAAEVELTLKLTPGDYQLRSTLTSKDGKQRGAYFVIAERSGD